MLRLDTEYAGPRRKLAGELSLLTHFGIGGLSEVGHLLDYTPKVVVGHCSPTSRGTGLHSRGLLFLL